MRDCYEGIISQLRGGGPHPIIQTTVAISPGSSGGGLFNAKGELVGITTFYMKNGQSLNFAVPVEWIAEVAQWEVVSVGPSPNKPQPKGEAPIAPASGAAPEKYWIDRALDLNKARDWSSLLAWGS